MTKTVVKILVVLSTVSLFVSASSASAAEWAVYADTSVDWFPSPSPHGRVKAQGFHSVVILSYTGLEQDNTFRLDSGALINGSTTWSTCPTGPWLKFKDAQQTGCISGWTFTGCPGSAEGTWHSSSSGTIRWPQFHKNGFSSNVIFNCPPGC